MYFLYQYVSLKDLLVELLSLKMGDYSEHVWFLLEKKIPEPIFDKLDFDYIDLFLHDLMERVDYLIRVKTQNTLDYTDYIFFRWLSETSVLIRRI